MEGADGDVQMHLSSMEGVEGWVAEWVQGCEYGATEVKTPGGSPGGRGEGKFCLEHMELKKLPEHRRREMCRRRVDIGAHSLWEGPTGAQIQERAAELTVGSAHPFDV